jgi:prepilin-type N-terminal cleavage/methylation domain-containing protein
MKQRGFTLVEMMFATMLTGILVGALVTLFVFVSNRAQYVLAENAAMMQANSLAQQLEFHIDSATNCTVGSNVNGNTLKCDLPATAVDKDNDGNPDSFGITGVTNTGTPRTGRGQRVTYYWGNTTGAQVAATGSNRWFWRAWKSDDSIPGAPDRDAKFGTYYGGASSAWNLIESVSFTQDTTNRTVTFTIVASKLAAAERKAEASQNDRGYRFTLTRTVPYQRNTQ